MIVKYHSNNTVSALKMKKVVFIFIFLLQLVGAPLAYAELLILGVDQDTYIDSISPNGNFGGRWNFLISGMTGKSAYGLLHFDTTPLPDSATIESAQLTFLIHGNNSTNSYFIHPLLRAWDETSATWVLAEPGVFWTNPGGDYDQSAYVAIPLTGPYPDWVIMDVTSLVSDEAGRLKDGIANNGLVLRADAGYTKSLSSEFTYNANATTCHSCHGFLPPERDEGKSFDCIACHSRDGIPLSGEPTLIIQYQITDSDGDGVFDGVDNCPTVSNAGQEDSYPPGGNAIGDACECESDFDCDGDVDGTDAFSFKTHYGRSLIIYPCAEINPCQGDFSCDGDVDGTDAVLFKSDFGRGASGNRCPACDIGDWCSGAY